MPNAHRACNPLRRLVTIVNCLALLNALVAPTLVHGAESVVRPTGPVIVTGPGAPAASPGKPAAAALPIKDAARFRADAARYDQAVAAIRQIARVKLASQADIEAAVRSFERYRPYLKLASSKFVVTALDDRTYQKAVAQRLVNEASARAFGLELAADTKRILKLDGAAALQSQFVSMAKADAAVIRATAVALADATARLSSDATLARTVRQVIGTSTEVATHVLLVGPIVLLAAALVMPAAGVLVGVFAAPILAVASALLIAAFGENVGTEEGRDALADCMRDADARFANCRSAAADDPIPGLSLLACDVAWVADYGACLVK